MYHRSHHREFPFQSRPPSPTTPQHHPRSSPPVYFLSLTDPSRFSSTIAKHPPFLSLRKLSTVPLTAADLPLSQQNHHRAKIANHRRGTLSLSSPLTSTVFSFLSDRIPLHGSPPSVSPLTVFPSPPCTSISSKSPSRAPPPSLLISSLTTAPKPSPPPLIPLSSLHRSLHLSLSLHRNPLSPSRGCSRYDPPSPTPPAPSLAPSGWPSFLHLRIFSFPSRFPSLTERLFLSLSSKTSLSLTRKVNILSLKKLCGA